MANEIFIERLHEAENLTDNLEDPEARWLLEWGTAQIEKLVAGAHDAEAAGERVNALMGFMRSLNHAAGSLPQPAPERLSELCDRYAQTFGGTRSFDPSEHARVISALANLSTRDALAYLIEWAASTKA